MDIQWQCKPFHELSPHELYKILQLRNAVFVVEQHCIFQDADDKDEGCLHLMGFSGSTLAAYARLAPPGYIYWEVSIGRVVTSPACRNRGLGKELMSRCVDTCKSLFGKGPIRIGAQCYLLKFYTALGFKTAGEIYLEDGIEHVQMLLQAAAS